MDKRIIEENSNWINETWGKLDKKLSRVAIKSRDKLPYTTVNGIHDNRAETEPDWWTNGFWGGMMWLMYKATGNEEYMKTAIRSEELLNPVLLDAKALHHDVGFMWHLTSGAHYKITGDKKAFGINFLAAATLFSRYHIDGGYIQAWNTPENSDENHEGWSIIDCLMNIVLLYWASDVTNNPRFKKVAIAHADMALRDHIRPDGSINHIVEHNPSTGEVLRVYAGQGYSDTSCWSRGLAWAIYGMILSYIYTEKKEYLDAAKKTADYFIVHSLKFNYRTPVDFKAPDNPLYYDSTAGACAACGMLEIAKYVSEGEAEGYTLSAIRILKAIDESFCNYEDNEDAIVMMGTERYVKSDEDKKGLHIPIIYGDFFFVEALFKLKGNDFLIW